MSSQSAAPTPVVTPAATPTMSRQEFAARAAESNQLFILGMVIPFFVVAFISVSARTYVRTRIVKVVGVDDWIMLMALACACVSMGIFSWQTQHGLGRHLNTIPNADMMKLRMGNLIFATIGAVLGMSCVKISMCFLLMRFVQHKIYKRSLWGLIVFLVCFTIACWCTLIFWCNPVAGFWDLSLRRNPDGSSRCYSIVHFTNISIMNTSFNMFTDVLLATIPIPIIWKLQINRRQKISLIGVLSLGYVAVALGVVKAIKQVNLPKDRDSTWTQGVQMWGFVQLSVSITAGCMPALRPLFSFLSDAVSSRSKSKQLGGTSGQNARSGYLRQYDSSGTNAKGGGLRSFGGGELGDSMQMGAYPRRDVEAGTGGKAYITSSGTSRSLERESDGKSWVDGDSGSEKDILPHGAKPMGIVMTTAFTVKSDSART